MAQGMAKGSSFERCMCRAFSKWWTNNVRDDIYWRTAGSGAMATTRRKHGRTAVIGAGDMGIVDPIGKPFLDKFFIEFKCYAPARFGEIFSFIAKKKTRPNFIKFWEKACAEAGLVGKSPMMVVRLTRVGDFIFITSKTAIALTWCGRPHIRQCTLNVGGRLNTESNVVVYPLDVFFSIPSHVFMRACEERL